LRGDARDTAFLGRRFDRSDEVFARLNAALAHDGAVLRIGEDVQAEAPIHLVFVGANTGRDVAWHARHLLELRRGARATVVEHYIAHDVHANLGNALSHVHLAPGAALRHARMQADSANATLFNRVDAVLGRDARYRRVDLETGSALSRNELNVRLEGEGAQLSANGVLFADARRHVDTRLGIEHIARDTGCELLWRGLADGRGRAAFHGGIVIRAGADGTVADLSNKNLLLSANAEIDTQPVLEIHADEVKAAHGATVGQLDPTALFYLRSRGLDQAQARRLLTAAFCRETVAGFGDDAVRAMLEAALDGALRWVHAA
jgi:Fe-S cluster assembly protein SufD